MNSYNDINLSVVIPTLNAAEDLPSCLAALDAWPGSAQLIVVDSGSDDTTLQIATDANAVILPSGPGRGEQLARGGEAAQGAWLMFLHADSVLEPSWVDEVRMFTESHANHKRAAAFRFSLNDDSPQARRVEKMVAWRCRVLGLPYGDQGLLIHRDFYNHLSGFKALPLMEDVDLIRRIGKDRIYIFKTAAVTSADRFRRDGWWVRPSRNLFCLFMYVCGLPPRWIARLYA
ncbi:MAG: TIGR04283 family arsenosugar biosynthesis glycosyltransferase [Rhodospirillales bacterium]|jgi:rSAM/selenodomain-associated transferase 2